MPNLPRQCRHEQIPNAHKKAFWTLFQYFIAAIPLYMQRQNQLRMSRGWILRTRIGAFSMPMRHSRNT